MLEAGTACVSRAAAPFGAPAGLQSKSHGMRQAHKGTTSMSPGHGVLCLSLLVLSTATLMPGIYTITGNVSPWWYTARFLVLDGSGNSSVVLFGWDRESDCIIPGCEWPLIYRADMDFSEDEWSRARGLLSGWLLVAGLAWHLGFKRCCFLVLGLSSVTASNEGYYRASVSVVNPLPGVPQLGDAVAELQIRPDGQLKGSLLTWFTTHIKNTRLHGAFDDAALFNSRVPEFYAAAAPLFRDSSGNNFSLPGEPLLGYGVPGNLKDILRFPMYPDGCHPQEVDGPRIAYEVASMLAPVLCLQYASGGLIVKALQDSAHMASLHTWQASDECGPLNQNATDFPYKEYRWSSSCDPWADCAPAQVQECLAHSLPLSGALALLLTWL